MGNNWAVILAAGSSRRMGTQKLLLPFGESTMIETVIENVLSSSIEHVMVVLGANQEKIQDTIGSLPVQFCHNKEHEKGMLSSVICGIRALPEDALTALIFLALRMSHKILVSELMYRRSKLIVREEMNGEEVSE